MGQTGQKHKRKGFLLIAAIVIGGAACVSCSSIQKKDVQTAENGQIVWEAKKIGVMTGSTGETYVEDNHPKADLKSYESIADGVLALQSGKLDYVVTAYTTALNYVRNNPNLAILERDLTVESSAIAAAKGSKLIGDINGVLDQFREDGTLNEVISHWIKEGNKPYDIEEIPEVTDGPVLEVAVAANREPMCFVKDNEISGLDCEIIERVAYELGMKVSYSDMQFSALIAAVQSGKADVVISNVTPTPERMEMVDFTTDYFTNSQVLLGRAGGSEAAEKSSLEYTDIAQFAGKKVGVKTGAYFDTILEEYIPDAKAEYYNSFNDQAEALLAGKIDGFLLDEPIARDMLQEVEGVDYIPQKIKEDSYAFMVSKENTQLADDINRVLSQLREDKTVEACDQVWFGTDEEKKALPKLEEKKDKPALTAAVNSGSAPFVYIKDGEVVGYDIDLLMRICDKLGYRLEVEDMEFGAILPSVVSGRTDIGASCITVTPEREESVVFTDPDYTGGVVMMVRAVEAEKSGSFFGNLRESFDKAFIRENRWRLVLSGLGITVLISILAGILGSVIGFGICMMRRSARGWLKIPALCLIRIVQGTPVVVLLMILYYLVFTSVNSILVAVLGFAVNFAVYVSEMMRTGIEAVDKGQIEAAYAMGFKKTQTFWKITFPQAARHFLPIFRGEFISMVKMTSVVGYIAIQDLTKVSDIIRSRTYDAFFPLIATAVIYFCVSWCMTLVLTIIEKKVDPKQRKRRLKGVETV